MAEGTVALSGSANFVGELFVTETATDKLNNSSTVSYSLYINPPGNYGSYDLTSSHNSYTVTINGTRVASGNFTYDFRSPNLNTNKLVTSGTATVPHNADGTKTVASSGTINTTNSAVGSGAISSFNLVLTTFVPGQIIGQSAISTYKRYDGSAWQVLTTKKRYDGTNWVNISN